MNLNNARYELTAVRPDQYPGSIIPEVAFAGRSNVGKSSIINALLNRKGLARVAATPGKTREINFYNIDGCMYLVDLPGYGYANVSKDKMSSWGQIIETYLNLRLQLKLLILLVDIRHKPSDDDRVMYDWICRRNVPHLVVATKLDKVTRSQVKARLQEIKTTLGIDDDAAILAFSSETKQGRGELWDQIKAMTGLKE
ncbi:MAG: YihA family ribosome biogenesis GTP-binding protein [Ruminiclostridium sp.]|nr:YihA family ribosome biogenesis GTP-binding protein [Ruminiclostridium sp.]